MYIEMNIVIYYIVLCWAQMPGLFILLAMLGIKNWKKNQLISMLFFQRNR